MRKELGEMYPEAKSTVRTEVDYYGGEIIVNENEWDDVWQVTAHLLPLPDGDGCHRVTRVRNPSEKK